MNGNKGITSYLSGFIIVAMASFALWIFSQVATNGRPDWMVILAGSCGAAVAIAEISNRYRDEPLYAILSPFGIVYCAFNFALSVAALLLLIRYPSLLGKMAEDDFLVALSAGFGAIIVMRTKVAILKGPDDKDIAIGPDAVISALLRIADRQIDRYRAHRRQSLVVKHMQAIRDLGVPSTAYQYLSASLLALQNLDEDLKKALNASWTLYEHEELPDDVKYLALGFFFLTLVGENHFQSILVDAAQLKAAGNSPNTTLSTSVLPVPVPPLPTN